MIDERQEDLASLYALGLLEGGELAEFEAAQARDPELRRHVDGLREAAASLAHAAPPVEPPAALRERVLGTAAPASVIPFPSLIPWALAAGLAVAAVGSGTLYLGKRSENNLLRDQQRLAQVEVQSVRNQMEAERIVGQRQLEDARRQLADASRAMSESNRQTAETIAQLHKNLQQADLRVAQMDEKLKSETDLAKYKIAALVSLLGNSPQAMAVAVWNPMEQEGMLKVSKMPMPAAGKDYQLWVMDPDYPAPVSAGVFQVDPASGDAHVKFWTAKKLMTPVKFAVSIEQKGGMPTPHGPIVLLSE